MSNAYTSNSRIVFSFQFVLDLASGWYAAPWWTPYFDEEDQMLKQKEKLTDWPPNE
jgi:hypothetical protein